MAAKNPIPQTEENAVLLLAAAEKLGLGKRAVTTFDGGLQAPDEVLKEAGFDVADDGGTKKTAKKSTAKKSTAKKTAAKSAPKE